MEIEYHQRVGPAALQIACQRFGDPAAPAILLIMGGGAQMIAWPMGFVESLVQQGFQVIRFDNRDAGLSTHMTAAPVPDFAAVMAGDYATVSYDLSDMAADTVGLLDVLQLDKVHLVGASMGGMIAQTIAINYPHRVRSLTSMMSTTGNQAVGQTDYSLFAEIGQPPYADREQYIDWRVRSLKAIGSPGFAFEEAAVRENAGIAWDRDHDPLALIRQAVAVLKSGDRTSRLRQLRLPTLVIHGKADRMIAVSGGIATAEAIPGAILHTYEGMGHSLPKELWKEFAAAIADLANIVS
jgi:pimeloyl-ACP methyl ester carboxylesterase